MADTSAGSGGPRKGGTPSADPASALEDVLFCSQRVAKALEGIFEKHNLSFEEWSILRVLIGRDEVPMREVARGAGVRRQQLRGLLSRLQEKGMLLNQSVTVDDKKQRSVSATDRASALRPAIAGQLLEVLGDESAKSAQVFARAAQRLTRLERSLRKQAKAAKDSAAVGKDDDDD